MRIVLQRTRKAHVSVDGHVVGRIDGGFVALVGFAKGDDDRLFPKMIDKMVGLRVFGDAEGKFNLALEDVAGGILLISQFTLYADVRKGRRPSFTDALEPAAAEALYARFVDAVRRRYPAGPVESGVFGAMMDVHLVNAGPVTITIDSADLGLA